MKSLSILINTCDNYSDAWSPFFKILKEVWPESVNYDIYLNTETKKFIDPIYNIKVLNCVGDPSKTPWGLRLLQALERIDTEYVFFMLEDFFFEEKIDHNEVLKCLSYIESNKKIATITFTTQMECESKAYCDAHFEPLYPEYVKRKQFANFKVIAGPSIWRKKSLEKWTLKSDTPWGWEFFGSQRTWFSSDIFMGRSVNAKPIFVYDIIHGGAIHRGKWTANSVRRLNTKFDLGIDMSIRGVEEEEDFNPDGCIPLPWYKRINSIIFNRSKSICSVLYGILTMGR